MAFPPAKDPATPLGRYRRLSPTAGLYVSPLQIGTVSLGTKWIGTGNADKATAFKFLDAFFDAGGNLIDTANNSYACLGTISTYRRTKMRRCQCGESEEWIGE